VAAIASSGLGYSLNAAQTELRITREANGPPIRLYRLVRENPIGGHATPAFATSPDGT